MSVEKQFWQSHRCHLSTSIISIKSALRCFRFNAREIGPRFRIYAKNLGTSDLQHAPDRKWQVITMIMQGRQRFTCSLQYDTWLRLSVLGTAVSLIAGSVDHIISTDRSRAAICTLDTCSRPTPVNTIVFRVSLRRNSSSSRPHCASDVQTNGSGLQVACCRWTDTSSTAFSFILCCIRFTIHPRCAARCKQNSMLPCIKDPRCPSSVR